MEEEKHLISRILIEKDIELLKKFDEMIIKKQNEMHNSLLDFEHEVKKKISDLQEELNERKFKNSVEQSGYIVKDIMCNNLIDFLNNAKPSDDSLDSYVLNQYQWDYFLKFINLYNEDLKNIQKELE
jgi:hypothetical protein